MSSFIDDAEQAHAHTDWLVLRNADGQHALWPLLRPVPPGWQEVGPEGSHDAALAYVDAQWTDMRPGHIPPGR